MPKVFLRSAEMHLLIWREGPRCRSIHVMPQVKTPLADLTTLRIAPSYVGNFNLVISDVCTLGVIITNIHVIVGTATGILAPCILVAISASTTVTVTEPE